MTEQSSIFETLPDLHVDVLNVLASTPINGVQLTALHEMMGKVTNIEFHELEGIVALLAEQNHISLENTTVLMSMRSREGFLVDFYGWTKKEAARILESIPTSEEA